MGRHLGMQNRHLGWVLLIVFLQTIAMPTFALERTALVVGNSAYRDAPLGNPVNDASDVARVLEEQLGFEVILRTDVTKRQFKDAAKKFRKRLQRRGGVGLFYYAGHGIQADGHNYLIPVNANIDSETDVEYEAVDAGYVLGHMDEADASLNIVILDACRNNPYERSFRSASRGLVRLKIPAGEIGSLLAYSTEPGNVAADGRGRNSPYTAQLVKALKMPNLTLEQVFKQVAIGVYNETNQRQKPWTSQFLLEDFYFVRSQPDAVAKRPPRVSPTRPAPATRTATLTVRSNVYGDRVYIDGQHKGSTRLDMKLAPGSHTVRVEKEGYLPYEESVELQAGRNPVMRATLSKAPVMVERAEPVTAKPPPVALAPNTAVAPNAVNEPQKGKTWTEPITGMEFVWIPKGCNDIGSPETEQGRHDDERQHRVCVEGFWLGKYEVTNAQYRRYYSNHDSGGYNEHSMNGDAQPALRIGWLGATTFAKWLSQNTGKRLRLPTEAEWEYAARAGTETTRYWGDDPGSDEACSFANVHDRASQQLNWNQKHHLCDDGYLVTAPVGRFRPNPYGLHDMLGNAWEWTCSAYNADYGGAEKECANEDRPGMRVRRGGAFNDSPRHVRSAYRFRDNPISYGHDLGFRLAMIP